MSGGGKPELRGRRILLGGTLGAVVARFATVDEQRVRLARRTTTWLGTGAAGFTLVELLVTIVVLGVLSGVVVFSVGGLTGRASAAACGSERSALETALESYRAQHGAYATEPTLVAAGVLRSESSLYDVVLSGDSYELQGVGDCAGGDSLDLAGAERSSTTTTVPATTTTTAAPATTTTAPATTTTTKKPKKLSLASVCTPLANWPGERAWRIRNPNAFDVDFTLDAVGTTAAGSHLAGAAAPGDTTWYLAAAAPRGSRATLEALGSTSTKKSGDRRC
jgi:prepilin-type N-terminal cleavage/methylation domain-containing protein